MSESRWAFLNPEDGEWIEVKPGTVAVVDASHPHDGYAYDGCSCVCCRNVRALSAVSVATHPDDAFVVAAQRYRDIHEATHGEAEMCGGPCIVLGLDDDA